MDARIAESIMRTGEPDTLDSKQLDLAHEPLTHSPEPQPARAWARYGEQSIEVDHPLRVNAASSVHSTRFGRRHKEKRPCRIEVGRGVSPVFPGVLRPSLTGRADKI
jgi:hypothetical protein